MNEHAPALTANARNTIHTARDLSPEMKDLVAGVLRGQARTERANTMVVEDTDTLTEDTTPFTEPDTLTRLTFTHPERILLARVLTITAAFADENGTDARSLLALWERVQPDGEVIL